MMEYTIYVCDGCGLESRDKNFVAGRFSVKLKGQLIEYSSVGKSHLGKRCDYESDICGYCARTLIDALNKIGLTSK